MNKRIGVIQRYKDRLPVSQNTPIVSLHEGSTPLVKIKNLVDNLNLNIELYVKVEGLNPTGSFKDRGMTMAISKALEIGKKAVVCASTGNTSAAAAAYAARANMKSFVLIPEGKIAFGKLAQALVHGSNVLQINGNFDDGMSIVKELAGDSPLEIVNSINPYRLEGQKTAAFEIVDELGKAPDYHVLPVGNAGNISSYWMGYKEYNTKPVMVGIQAKGAAPFLEGSPIKNPETIATAIRIGNPQSWDLAQNAKNESGGWFDSVTDDEILEAQSLLSRMDGIFAEPASNASIAGVIKSVRENKIKQGSLVVCTLTGMGLKDPDIIVSKHKDKLIKIDANFNTVKDAIFSRI